MTEQTGATQRSAGHKVQPAGGRERRRYVLAEFPYPSGEGLHIGHAFTFTGADVHARYLRARGHEVLFPMGWDAFGLPTENAAIRSGVHPSILTERNTRRFREQMDRLALSFDWEREVNTTDPNYYRWTQWIFVQLFKHGLAYKNEIPINWCPSCKIGLANEEVIDGHCERCGAVTSRRMMNQWIIRITEYADRLIDGLDETEFIAKVKADQINWIGRSEGARIRFTPCNETETVQTGDKRRAAQRSARRPARTEPIEVFTTRPDTLWGCTYLVLAPEHPAIERYLSGRPEDNPVRRYRDEALRRSERDRQSEQAQKTGVPTEMAYVNPATGRPIPVWVADYVLGGYGTGAVMAVPAHDERDHEFATRFGLPILPVIAPPETWRFDEAAYTGLEGTLHDSGPLDGLTPPAAIRAAVEWLTRVESGAAEVSYHLRDWVFSRQHYWGEPIPMVRCQVCGWIPVPEEDLPVSLPEVERYEPTDTGESPLAGMQEWLATTCPSCGGPARRETDTMPNWAGSDWYFLRYCDPGFEGGIARPERLREWMPVDTYIGGDEHNTVHLLYSRFIYHFLNDIGAVPSEIAEPYRLRVSHGVILGPDHQRMSKSRGNVIVPDDYIAAYGADAVRCYLMFIGPFDGTMAWNDRALQGVGRFLKRFEGFVRTSAAEVAVTNQAGRKRSDKQCHLAIARAAEKTARDIEAFKFNTALAAQMECLNTVQALTGAGRSIGHDDLAVLCRILAPFAPLVTNSLWLEFEGGGSIHSQPWPVFTDDLAESEVTIAVQVNGKLRGTFQAPPDADEHLLVSAARSAGTVGEHLRGRTERRVVVVPGRAVNFVVE
jgi:leucyl-tRNA synthetase